MITAYDDPAVREKMHQALLDFPSNGKPPRGMSTEEGVLTDWMIQIGLIAEHEQKSPCSCCGRDRVIYHYCKITPAGRFFMAAMDETQPADEDRKSAAIGEMQRLGAPAGDWLNRHGFENVKDFIDRATRAHVRQWEEFAEKDRK